jgi:hypothetical protein
MGKKEELKTHVQNDQTKTSTSVEATKIVEETKISKPSKILVKTPLPPSSNFSIKKIISIIAIASISFFIFILLLPTPYYKTGFRNISELQEYAKTIDEWIEIENDNIFFPSYNSYYGQKFTQTFWTCWKEKLGWFLTKLYFKKEPIFSSSFFKELLEDVTTYRLSHEWQGDFVQKIETNKDTKIVVFGSLQGSYHPLVRYLLQLRKLDIIDDNLILTSQDFYIVLLGNVINRSPYTIETFSIALKLMQKNPENVIYLRGTNEYFECWKNHTLSEELKIRCKDLSSTSIPLKKEVNNFFNTLPQVIYCTISPIEKNNPTYYFKLLESKKNH